MADERSKEVVEDKGMAAIMSDPLMLTNSDYPGMSLTTTPFDGTNFLAWSRQVQRGLTSKLKQGFIDGSEKEPAVGTSKHSRWKRCNSMVACWILNSMTTEISNGFVYTDSAKSLWKEVCDRYHQNNGPLVYQLQQELSQITQGNMDVTTYYVKLKRIWEELNNLNGMPVCSCGALESCKCGILAKVLEMDNQTKVMQFLLKLNADYESVKSQILTMEPLPPISLAFNIVQRVEKQKQVTNSLNVDPVAFMANQGGGRNNRDNYRESEGNKNGSQSGERKDLKKSRNYEKRFCTHCKEEGHTKDYCFELVGFPDWFKGKKAKRGRRLAGNVETESGSMADTPIDNERSGEQKASMEQQMVQAVTSLTNACQEVMRAFKSEKAMNAVARGGKVNHHFSGPFE